MADVGICPVDGCSKPARKGKGRTCSMHDARMRRGGSYERRVERMTLDQILGGKTMFGLWQILGEGDPYRRRSGEPIRQARVRCHCGTEKLVAIHTLKQGNSRHCGCRMAEITVALHTTHGDASRSKKAPEYGTWARMIARCEQQNSKDFADYGGRGIRVCERWRESYAAFLEDMGRRPAGCSIDRIEVDGDYEPGNCRWATPSQQARNKRNSRIVTYRGERVCLADACDSAGLPYALVHGRLCKGGPRLARSATPFPDGGNDPLQRAASLPAWSFSIA